MTARASKSNVLEACSFECRHIAHEAIAGRAVLDWISLQNSRALGARMSGGGLDELRGHPLAPKRPGDEKAHERPDLIFRFVRKRGTAERAVGCSWRDRAPRDRQAVEITEKPDRNAFPDPPADGLLSIGPLGFALFPLRALARPCTSMISARRGFQTSVRSRTIGPD